MGLWWRGVRSRAGNKKWSPLPAGAQPQGGSGSGSATPKNACGAHWGCNPQREATVSNTPPESELKGSARAGVEGAISFQQPKGRAFLFQERPSKARPIHPAESNIKPARAKNSDGPPTNGGT